MAEKSFTPEQASAIYANNRELLISAAAGSGKTTVLVERIMHLVRDKHIDINRMLVVTYTRAAAAEMRERLESALQEAAANDPAMARQFDLLSSAQISTIHSYCQKLVREHFRHCGVDPQFVLSDERTIKTIYQESMDEVLEAAYQAAKEDANLEALLSVVPEKNLITMMDELYKFLLTRPDPMGWLKQQAQQEWTMDTLENHPLTDTLLDECSLQVDNALMVWRQANQMQNDPAFPEKYQKTLSVDFITLTELKQAAQNGLENLCAKIKATKFMVLPTVKPTTEDEASLRDRFKAIRESYKNCLKEMKKVLPAKLEDALYDMNKMRPALNGLCWLMQALHEDFRSRKLERGVLDFGDLEHMTLEVLSDPELCSLEASRIDAVFVDEYQDVSAIQEAILNSVKREDGSQYFFYVGDVKQSIYRFRQAEPSLFLGKLSAFSDDEMADCRRIILNKNFRSREEVLSSVNRIFSHVMDRRVTEIDYDDSAKLYPGRPSTCDPQTELHLLTDVPKKERIIAQARVIAQDIQRTVGLPMMDANGQPGDALHYRDIVILMPTVKGVANQVEAELVKAGIPVYVDASMNAMSSEEVQQVAQHLSLLDNLRNDLALISELRSPLFNMNERELTEIRLYLPDAGSSYLDALLACAAQQEDSTLAARCKQVLEQLEHERFLYASMPVEEYLWDFLMRSGLYAHYGCQPGGKLRQANLRMMCYKAGEYAQNHTEGLSGFLSTLNKGNDETSPTVVNPWEDVVRIMTIHKSKGLEFPTVYVMGLEDQIQKRTVTRAISMHAKLGLSLMYMNKRSRTKRTTLLQNVIDLKTKAEDRAERARVLYVALTRPKNRLVMVGISNADRADVQAKVQNREMGGKLSLVRSAKTLVEWVEQSLTMEETEEGSPSVIPPMESSCQNQDTYIKEETDFDAANQQGSAVEFSTNDTWKTCGNSFSSIVPTSFPQKSGVWKVVFHSDAVESSDSHSEENVNANLDVNLKFFDQIIPVASHVEDPLTPIATIEPTPLKIGVTALCRALQENSQPEDEEETAERKRYPLLHRQPKLLSSLPEKPEFLQSRPEDASLQRGVCTHLLLSTVSIEGLSQSLTEGNVIDFLEAHRENLRLSGRFSIQEASVADVTMAARFLTSEEGRKMLCSKEIRREWPFNLKIAHPMDTIVQGVIDLCYLEEEEWVLIDFKTDYVKDPQELWQRYRLQLSFYRSALEKATGRKVRRCGLYSLRLGSLITGDIDEV